jgi:hypothetical protein
VADHPPGTVEAGTMHLPRFVDAPQHEWSLWRDEFLCRCGLSGSEGEAEGLDVALTVHAGDPVAAVLGREREVPADFIALAWHGSLLQGRAKTLQAIIGAARIPVLILRIP